MSQLHSLRFGAEEKAELREPVKNQELNVGPPYKITEIQRGVVEGTLKTFQLHPTATDRDDTQ